MHYPRFNRGISPTTHPRNEIDMTLHRETDPMSCWEYDASLLIALAQEMGEGEHSRGMFGGSLVLVRMMEFPETWKVLTKGTWLPALEMTFGATRLGLCQRGLELLCGEERTRLADEITGYAKECHRGYSA
jgi:hypothetical protein